MDKKGFGSKRNLGLKKFGPKKCGLQKLRPPKIGSKKFGQNRVSKSWDNADMDKYCQDIYIAWTNALASVENCPRNLHLKFGLKSVVYKN